MPHSPALFNISTRLGSRPPNKPAEFATFPDGSAAPAMARAAIQTRREIEQTGRHLGPRDRLAKPQNQTRTPAVQILPVGLPRTAALRRLRRAPSNGSEADGTGYEIFSKSKIESLELADRNVRAKRLRQAWAGRTTLAALTATTETPASIIVWNQQKRSHPRSRTQ
jgi:hypothetical protein